MVSYPDNILNLLNKAKIETGDTIKVTTDQGTFQGILMPHHEFSQEDIITIKLDSGYNIGIAINEPINLEFIKRGEKQGKLDADISEDDKKHTISILGTGGTIASYVDYRTGAVHPTLSTDDLALSVPELANICNIRAKVLFSFFSEDMKIEHWQKIAKETASELNNGVKGVIIAHGTDTMGYSAAALSFMLSDLRGPVILVGSQRSSDRPSTDADLNLVSAGNLAVNSDLGEVVVAMHVTTSDTEIAVHRGCRVRKMHTSSRNAFCSVNEEPIGYINKNELSLRNPYKNRSNAKVKVKEKMNENVALFYSYPGVPSHYFDYLAEKNQGIVIAGTGLGHVPKDLVESIRSAISAGVVVIMMFIHRVGTFFLRVLFRVRICCLKLHM